MSRASISGCIEVPGDKSMSHRAVLLAALAEGDSRVRGFLRADDTQRSVELVRALGAEVKDVSPTELRIRGRGLRGLREPANVIDAGNSGTTLRIGAGLLAGQPFFSTITGDASLRRRPMGRIVAPLQAMGAVVRGRAAGTRAPLTFCGGSLRGLRVATSVASAQVKSALLIAGVRGTGEVSVIEPEATRDHTERMLLAMGALLLVDGREARVTPTDELAPLDVDIPGDFSSAAFFVVLAASVPGSELRVRRVGTNPTRTGLVEVLRRMGATIVFEESGSATGEPCADLVVRGGELRATNVVANEVPRMIDELPALCVAAAFAKGRTEIQGASELRFKESNRIVAMVEALRALGIPAGELADGLWIEGPATLRAGVRCETHDDHRVAMALATLGAAGGIDVELSETASVATSFPDFFETLRRIAGARG